MVCIIAVVGVSIAFVYMNTLISQYPIESLKDHILFDKDQVTFLPEEQVEHDKLPSYELEENAEYSDSEIVNVLLVGSDSYEKNVRGRSDSIMIATLDKKHGKLKLTSILRDTWVYLPGKDSKGSEYGWNRVNAAYAYGDVKFLMETIQYNFNIKLDKYVVVNFTLFKDIINTLDGIELNISAKEAEYLRGRSEAEAGPDRKNMKEGLNKMDGSLALEYARARNEKAGPFSYKDENGKQVNLYNDFARSARQRYVIETIFQRMKDKSLNTLVSIAADCMKNTRTNIPLEEMTEYIESVLSIGTSTVSQLQIPYTGLYEDKKMSSGAQVLYLSKENMQANGVKIREFIFE